MLLEWITEKRNQFPAGPVLENTGFCLDESTSAVFTDTDGTGTLSAVGGAPAAMLFPVLHNASVPIWKRVVYFNITLTAGFAPQESNQSYDPCRPAPGSRPSSQNIIRSGITQIDNEVRMFGADLSPSANFTFQSA